MISPRVMIKGFVVGSTMMVPGVSGGSMAMILGIYDRLISSISSFFKDWKGNSLYLLSFGIPALLGIVLCAGPITNIITLFPVVSMFFFFGLVFGAHQEGRDTQSRLEARPELRHRSCDRRLDGLPSSDGWRRGR